MSHKGQHDVIIGMCECTCPPLSRSPYLFQTGRRTWQEYRKFLASIKIDSTIDDSDLQLKSEYMLFPLNVSQECTYARGSMDQIKGRWSNWNTTSFYLKNFRRGLICNSSDISVPCGQLGTSLSPCHHESKGAKPSFWAIRAQCAYLPE